MKTKFSALILTALSALSSPASAHFVELTADKNVVSSEDAKSVSLDMTFTHPFEGGPLMIMKRPQSFGVVHQGKNTDLTDQIQNLDGFKDLKWKYEQRLNRLGDYIFHVTPQPYFEPSEGKFIVHYTKTIISNGGGDDWDKMVGLPVEIRPLSRPYGLWTNNLFRGQVLQKGKPVPFAEIEVEYKNDAKISAPNDSFITQVIKADSNGVFAYAMPKAGWWGFAALIEDGETLQHEDGKNYIIEKGALIWVKTEDMR